MTATIQKSGKWLAAALGVSESTLSESVASERLIRGYPVYDWADRSENGRVQCYLVPFDVAEWLDETEMDAEPPRPSAPVVPVPLAPSPVIHVAAPEPDKTFDRLRDGYDHMLARTEREVERLQTENTRLRDDFFRLRDDTRVQTTEASERLNSLRLTHMEEINALRFQAMETKTELRIAEEGLSDDRSTVERLFETHGDSFFGTLQVLAAGISGALVRGQSEAPAQDIALLSEQANEHERPAAANDETPEHIASLAGEMFDAILQGDSTALGGHIGRCQTEIARAEWDWVGIALLDRLVGHDAVAVAATMRPVVVERAPMLLTLPPAMALPMLSGFGIDLTDEATVWLTNVFTALQGPP